MTDFHPIDRPTEPGWYWYYNRMGRSWHKEIVRVVAIQNLTVTIVENHERVQLLASDMDNQWYGPAIQEPIVAGTPSSFENGTYH